MANRRGSYTRTAEHRAKMSAIFRGRKLSPEHCANISAANKGKPKSSEHRVKIGAARRGKKRAPFSPEWLERMAEAQRGKRRSPETRAKISVAQKGPKNHNWMGGLSFEPYTWEFNAELKEEVRRRDGYKCQLCGAPQAECETRLPVHHVDYDKKNSDPVNLVALCVSCNVKVNTNRKHWKVFFQAMAIQRSISKLEKKRGGP